MNTLSFIQDFGLDALTSTLGITIKERDNLLVLDYDQIESPKQHPVVKECRGLILEKDTHKVVFRCMDRFFNYREADTLSHDYTNAVYFDKVDGSLIKIFFYNNRWYIATRGTIIADNETPFGVTFEWLVYKALQLDANAFQESATKYLNPKISYNFEITSIENRVVTRYEGYTLHYLSARDTETGEYVDEAEAASALGAVLLEPVNAGNSVEDVLSYVEKLPDLKEGLIAYVDGKPICKFKSTKYVEVHHKRGNGISLNGVRRLVIIGEDTEYLSYFPEELPLFEPYQIAYERLFKRLTAAWIALQDIEEQKDFALKANVFPFSSLLFSKRRDPEASFAALFNKLTEPAQFRLIDNYVEFQGA